MSEGVFAQTLTAEGADLLILARIVPSRGHQEFVEKLFGIVVANGTKGIDFQPLRRAVPGDHHKR
jgi:hypothetical protein